MNSQGRRAVFLFVGFLSAGLTHAQSPAPEVVRYSNDGVELVGEMLLPAKGENLPGIALIQGSGTSGRNNAWARQIAEAWVERGYAVLLPDKRGSGESGGNWRTADFTDLAEDAVASLRRLQAHPRVDRTRSGFLGLSQGGHVAPLAALLSRDAAFAITWVGSLQPMETQLYHELEMAYRDHGLDRQTIDYLQEFARFSFDYLRAQPPQAAAAWEKYLGRRQEIAASALAKAVETWPDSAGDEYWTFWRGIHDYDPMPYWRALTVGLATPGLALYGEKDRNVNTAASLEIAGRLPAAANFEAVTIPGAGHSLRDGQGRIHREALERTGVFLQKALEKSR